MKCKVIEKKTVDYLWAELPADQIAAIDGHLDNCAGCRSHIDQHRATIESIDKLPDIDPNPFLSRRIMASVNQMESPSTKQWHFSWRWVPAAVAVPVLLISTITLLTRDTGDHNMMPSEIEVAKTDSEIETEADNRMAQFPPQLVAPPVTKDAQSFFDRITGLKAAEKALTPEQMFTSAINDIKRERYNNAISILEKILTRHPNYEMRPTVADQLAKMHIFLGDFEKATVVIEQNFLDGFHKPTTSHTGSSKIVPVSSKENK